MKVLVLGASGLIGSHVLAALLKAGHQAVGVSRRKPAGAETEWKELDLSILTDAQAWIPHLRDIDAVINCVGIIREACSGDFVRLHQSMPVALFDACEQARVARVVQVSALGSEPHASTAYWRTKGIADADLFERRLSATVVRPSLVYGDDGASSRVFTMMATLPLAAMPMAHQALVQPIHVDDLTVVLMKLLCDEIAMPKQLAAVGPRVLSIASYIEALRIGMAAPPGLVLAIPTGPARLLARCAELIPTSALTRDSLSMLEKSADGSNTADAAQIGRILGKPLRDPMHFPGAGQKANAIWAWSVPLCRIVIAFLWLLTAYASWFGWPHEESHQWLMQCGLPSSWTEPVLMAAALLDAAIGMALLAIRWAWIWPLQMALVLGYTLVMSVCLPQFWMHPFGPLSKNLPLLAIMFMMWRATDDTKNRTGKGK